MTSYMYGMPNAQTPRPLHERRRGAPDQSGYFSRVPGPEVSINLSAFARSASVASMFNPISFAKASSSHHSSGGFGIEISPEPWIKAHPLNRRNAAECTEPPERTITVRPCGGATCDVGTKRPLISPLSEACPPRTKGQTIMIAENAGSFSQRSPGSPAQTKRREGANQPDCETGVRPNGEYGGKRRLVLASLLS